MTSSSPGVDWRRTSSSFVSPAPADRSDTNEESVFGLSSLKSPPWTHGYAPYESSPSFASRSTPGPGYAYESSPSFPSSNKPAHPAAVRQTSTSVRYTPSAVVPEIRINTDPPSSSFSSSVVSSGGGALAVEHTETLLRSVGHTSRKRPPAAAEPSKLQETVDEGKKRLRAGLLQAEAKTTTPLLLHHASIPGQGPAPAHTQAWFRQEQQFLREKELKGQKMAAANAKKLSEASAQVDRLKRQLDFMVQQEQDALAKKMEEFEAYNKTKLRMEQQVSDLKRELHDAKSSLIEMKQRFEAVLPERDYYADAEKSRELDEDGRVQFLQEQLDAATESLMQARKENDDLLRHQGNMDELHSNRQAEEEAYLEKTGGRECAGMQEEIVKLHVQLDHSIRRGKRLEEALEHSNGRCAKVHLLEERIRSMEASLARAGEREVEAANKIERLGEFEKEREHWANFFNQLLQQQKGSSGHGELPNTEILPLRVMKMVQALQQESVLATQKLASYECKLEASQRQLEASTQERLKAQEEAKGLLQNLTRAHAEAQECARKFKTATSECESLRQMCVSYDKELATLIVQAPGPESQVHISLPPTTTLS
jgi:hypothetical protein